MHVELVRTQTPDGLRLDGALIEPPVETAAKAASARNERVAVLCLHGVGSSFYGSNLFEEIAPALRERGFGVLWANTRGHDGLVSAIATGKRRNFGAAAEIVDECRYDVAGWSGFLRDRGYDRVALLGHSLGAIKSLYAAANGASPAFVVAASPPSLSCERFLAGADAADFRHWIGEAKRLVDAGAGERFIEPTVPFPLVITARTYWDKYGPDDRYDFLRFFRRAGCPVLFTYGELELRGTGTPFSGLPARIGEATGEDDDVAVSIVPGGDHSYRRVESAWSTTVMSWIDRTASR